MKPIHQQIIEQIKQHQNILILPSSPPDGDSLGSAVAFYLALRKLGKHATVVCADPVPEVYQFLPNIQEVNQDVAVAPDFIVTIDTQQAEVGSLQSQVEHNKINIILTAKAGQLKPADVSFSYGEFKFDLIITVDTAETQQLGKFYQSNVAMFSEIPVINIDHHASNESFGHLNYVDIMSSSTCEMVQGILENLEEITGQQLIDADTATALLAGIITDTGSFQHSNTSPKSFANSAKLIRRGAKQQEIIQHVYKTKRLSTLRLWGRVLTNIKVDKTHRFLWSVLTRKDFQETGSRPDETGSIIDELMTNAPEVDLVLLLKEKDNGQLSGSIRAIAEGVDASEIAGFFDGGGHQKAAGFRLEKATFEEQGQKVIQKIVDFQARRLHLEQPAEAVTAPEHQPVELPVTQNTTIQVQEHQNFKIKPGATQNLEPGVIYKFEP